MTWPGRAWTYGTIIDHGPLMGWARGTQALAAIWEHRYADAVGYTEDGLDPPAHGRGRRPVARDPCPGPGRAPVTSPRRGPPSSRQGGPRGPAGRPAAHGMAGEFAFDTAKLRYYEALVLATRGLSRRSGGRRQRRDPPVRGCRGRGPVLRL